MLDCDHSAGCTSVAEYLSTAHNHAHAHPGWNVHYIRLFLKSSVVTHDMSMVSLASMQDCL